VTDLLALTSDLPTATVPAGETVIDEGAPAGRMLVLVSGSVVVEHDGEPFARIDTPGAVFGEMSVVLDRPATATVRAADDVLVRVVEDPVQFLTDHPGAALAVLRTTASRLDGLTKYLVDVKRQFADAAGHLGMVDEILDHLVHHQGPRSRTGSARDPEGDHTD
jgi:CRP-like cAMP-binding protein